MSMETAIPTEAPTETATPVSEAPATPSALSTPTPEVVAPAAAGSWRDSLSVDLQGNPTLANIKSVEDLAEQHVNVQKLIGADKMPRPNEEWTEQDWNEHHTRMGRPGKVEDYDLSGLEFQEGYPVDEALQGGMVASMHKRGLSQDQVSGILQDYYDMTGEQLGAQAVDVQQTTENRIGDLRKEWGKSYDAQVDLAKRAIMAGAGEGYKLVGDLVLKDGTLVGDHPLVLKAFATLGGKMSEHGLVGATASRASKSPSEARSEASLLMTDQTFLDAYLHKEHREHAIAVQRMADLTVASEEQQPTG